MGTEEWPPTFIFLQDGAPQHLLQEGLCFSHVPSLPGGVGYQLLVSLPRRPR